jgi:hypothetical protein
MKYALIKGVKTEATKGAKGICQGCGSELIAKCGETKAHHWAHKGKQKCEPWWENETEWHRAWKDRFPSDWQEVAHPAENGAKHIADVKTEEGWVLEFQHSFLKPDERRSRNEFYPKLAWIVNGARRPTDRMQFEEALGESSTVIKSPQILRISFPDECRLIKEWHNDKSLVFFDFQETKEANKSMLWLLYPRIADTEAHISPFLRQNFIELHKANKFDEILRNIILPIHKELANDFLRRRKMIENGPSFRTYNLDRDLAMMRVRQRRYRPL